MGKLSTYFVIMTGLMLLFYFTGLIQDCPDDELCRAGTVNSLILDLAMRPENMQSSTLATKVTTALLLAVAITGIVVGFVTRNFELIAVTPLATYLLALGFDFLAVFNKVSSTNPELALLFFAPVLGLYIITIVEWWRGRD